MMRCLIIVALIISLKFSFCLWADNDIDSFGGVQIIKNEKIDIFSLRKWKSSKGEILTAKLNKINFPQIHVSVDGGKELLIPIYNLSPEDQKLIYSHIHQNENLTNINPRDFRVWMSNDGKTLVGKIHKLEKNSLSILRKDNRIVSLPKKLLTPKDQEVLRIYGTQENLLSVEDAERLLCLYKWRDKTDRFWRLQLEFLQSKSSDERKELIVAHRPSSGGHATKVYGSWEIRKNGLLFTCVGNGGGDVLWKYPRSKSDRRVLTSEIVDLFNYFGFALYSNLTLVPDV